MSTARKVKLSVGLTLVGSLLALTPLAASATDGHAATAASSRAPVTTFVTVKPWTSRGRLQVKATTRRAGTDSLCLPSSITGRRDAYRCFIGDYVIDPAFRSPTANSIAFRTGSSWQAYTHVARFDPGNPGDADTTRPFEVKLTNGATCRAATGAGPASLPRFPYWAGFCTGGPYGRAGALWRATEDDGKNANYPLLALDSKRTKWSVAVEHPEGKVTFQPARTVYR